MIFNTLKNVSKHMTKNMKFVLMTGALVISAAGAYAVDQSVDVSAEFRQALSLTKNADVNFSNSGVIEYAAGHSASDKIRLGTNGSIAYVGTALSGPATGIAGDVDINGAATNAVDITCSDATISDGTNTLTVEMAIDMNTGGAFSGAALACSGLSGTALTHTLDGTDKILLGGEISGGGTLTNNIFNSANSGGVAAQVRVVYQ